MDPNPEAGLDTGVFQSENSNGKANRACCKCCTDWGEKRQITCNSCLVYICDYCHWCEDIDHEIRRCGICKLGWCEGCCAEITRCEGCGQWMCADCRVTCKVCSKAICGGRAADFEGEICSRGGCSSSRCGNNALCSNDAHTCHFCAKMFCQTCVNICAHCQVSVCPKESKYLLQCDSELDGASCLAFMCFLCILKKDPCPACNKRPSKALINIAHKGSQNLLRNIDNGEGLPVIQPAGNILAPILMQEAEQESESGSYVVGCKGAAAEPIITGTSILPDCMSTAAVTLPVVSVKPVMRAPSPERDFEFVEEKEEPPALLSSDDEYRSAQEYSDASEAEFPESPLSSTSSWSFVPTPPRQRHTSSPTFAKERKSSGVLSMGSNSSEKCCCKCYLPRSTAQITCDVCLIFICEYCHWCEDTDHEIRKCQTCSRGLCKSCCADVKRCESCGQ